MFLLSFYKQRHGDCNVPYRNKEDPNLGDWVHKMRSDERRGVLKPEHKTRLDQLGFVFDSLEKRKERLWSESFERLKEYQKILKKGGILHLKTDDPTLYEFSLESIGSYAQAEILYHDDDIYAKPLPMPELEIKTYYERMHLAIGRTIKYIRFTFKDGCMTLV